MVPEAGPAHNAVATAGWGISLVARGLRTWLAGHRPTLLRLRNGVLK
jgi:hypothetical protein